MERIELKQHKTGIWIQVLIILILTVVIFFAAYYQPGKSCTIFTAVQGDQVMYGNSEDQHNPDPVIGFFPPSSEGSGSSLGLQQHPQRETGPRSQSWKTLLSGSCEFPLYDHKKSSHGG